MKRALKAVAQVFRWLAGALLSYAIWSVWLVLAILAAAQIYVASTNELAVPDFVLRRLESKLEDAGLKATFDGATFDPTGRVLVTSPRLFMPGFGDPIVTARALYVDVNPWLLAIGRVELQECRVLEGEVLVPAMLSPSGRSEPVVRDIDAFIVPGEREFRLRHVTGRISSLPVSVHGGIARARNAPTQAPEQLATTLRARFGEFCRIAVEFSRRLDAFEEPSLSLELEPLGSHGAVMTVDFGVRGLRLETPFAASVSRFRATTRFPLFGDAPAVSELDITAEEAHLPNGVELRGIRGTLRGRTRPTELKVDPVEIEVALDSLRVPDGTAEAVSGIARPETLSHWRIDAVGRVLESAIAVRGEADLQAKTAQAVFRGVISPRVLDAISARAKVDVRKYFSFERLDCQTGEVRFQPGWKFERLTAAVSLRGIDAYGVTMDEGSARVELTPGRLYAPEAFGRIGPNFARGSYEHDFATREFRFLLDGRLRPLDISGWFHDWWPHFFQRFEFPVQPPLASVDVHGFWRDGRRTGVFVFADADGPVVLGEKLQRVRTRLFVRPGFYDGLELFGWDDAPGAVNATFTVQTDMTSGKWRSIDIAGKSTVSLAVARKMTGELSESVLAPFELANPPTITARGHFDGPAFEGTGHHVLDLEATSTGRFKLHGFPLDDVSFKARLHDDELVVDATQAKFAGGAVKLHAKVWGGGQERRVGFEAGLTDASLGTAVAALQNLAAERKGVPPPPPGKFVQEKANVHLTADASGEGRYGDLLSFHGNGTASLSGQEIGEVALFGPLSDLLKFTALRFTTAKATFKLNGPKLEFPEVTLRGANSAADAHGEYALDRRQLDFRVKVFPFQESGSVIKTVVGAVLAPISNVLEVKLTGSLEKPDWAFVIGPTNLIRSLAADAEPTSSEQKPAEEKPAGDKPADKPPPPSPQPSSPTAAGASKPN